ncbi:MAG: PqqD family protein [Clostridium butyricum]|uniref:PqqD family protein n=1 Tax=Clostridium TaxID=1485 RepID=UPI00290442F4|nr:PqqD family protein [Clostridium sp.]MDU1117065.1 PqqD family protein [Clostridium sp.]MDU7713389.1 PqqD family protein [Clostridium butyricum]
MIRKMRLTKNSSLVETRKNDELIILNMDNGKYYGLQDTSLEIWELLDVYTDESELLEQVLKIYKENKDTIKKEVKQFIFNLTKERLVIYEKN